MILADAAARWQEMKSSGATAVQLITGTDEHGSKVLQSARLAALDPQTYCDKMSETFKELGTRCGLVPFRFNRTTAKEHGEKVRSLWRRLDQNGAIYKGEHTGWYCVSDECFYPETRLKSVRCPKTGLDIRLTLEGGKPVELVKESNYKFRLSQYIEPVRAWLRAENPIFPESRLNDLEEALSEGLPDLSISRSRSSNPWGIQVPGDPDQTIYVWLDALANYFDDASLKAIPDVHVIGKDILKFHAIYWPAFLMAADLPLPKKILTHGHWIVKGEKMSKSIGNVVDPRGEIDYFGVDAFRYLLLRIGKVASDSDCSREDMTKRYNLELANVLGNLISRLCNPKFYPLSQSFKLSSEVLNRISQTSGLADLRLRVSAAYDNYRFHMGLEEILAALNKINSRVNELKPWELEAQRRSSDLDQIMPELLFETLQTVSLLYPVMPRFCSALLARTNCDQNVPGSFSVMNLFQTADFRFPRLKLHLIKRN